MWFYTPVYVKPKIAVPCFIVFILGPDKELLRKAANASGTFVFKVLLMSRWNKDQWCLHPKPVNKSNTLSMTRNSNLELTNRKMDTLSMTKKSKNHTPSSGSSPYTRFMGVPPRVPFSCVLVNYQSYNLLLSMRTHIALLLSNKSSRKSITSP